MTEGIRRQRLELSGADRGGRLLGPCAAQLAQINKAPIAIEAVERIDVLFAIEREINGMTPQERVRVRNERSRSLVIELGRWLREQRARVSKNSETGKAIDYSLKRWSALTRFLDDGGRLCMSNNAAERELRAIALGRPSTRGITAGDGRPCRGGNRQTRRQILATL